jgi:hypothetical protein
MKAALTQVEKMYCGAGCVARCEGEDAKVKKSRGKSGRRWLLWSAAVLLALVALGAGVLSWFYRRAEPFLRVRIVAALQERFHARVELDSVHIVLADGVWAEGHGLRIWPPAQVEGISVPAPSVLHIAKPAPGQSGGAVPSLPATAKNTTSSSGAGLPLIRLDEFRFHAPWRFQPGKPLRIEVVQLKGLEMHLPPRSHFSRVAAASPATGSAALTGFQIDTIECSAAQLTLETDKPGKLPLSFAISRLRLSKIATAGALAFDADLINPRPQGKLHITGGFGPWLLRDPGESPISGDYLLDRADLASFKEIAGTLTSTGHYRGTLRDLAVDGQTQTPDFRLTHFGNALPLQTSFHAQVDATNGDTRLDWVDAMLGHSHFAAKGTIRRVPAVDGSAQSPGHDIALAVNVDRARIEDFLRLASHAPDPLLTGAVVLQTALHIPPGAVPMHKRIRLDGSFRLEQARFTSPKIQDRVEQLSLRGQGLPGEVKSTDPAAIPSTMKGDFHLANGLLNLPSLDYEVPGARIQLKGTYGVEGGTLDFAGTARLQATVSQMVGGWKGALLKPFNGLFRKNGAGAEIPIRIQGTREQPEFGVEVAGREFTFPSQPKQKP